MAKSSQRVSYESVAVEKPKRGKKKAARNHRSYVKVRTVLDSLEVMALNYYLKGASTKERVALAEQIKRDVLPLIIKYSSEGIDRGCGPGLFLCDGCCVPYPCPEDFLLA